jgi:hypothetical protein
VQKERTNRIGEIAPRVRVVCEELTLMQCRIRIIEALLEGQRRGCRGTWIERRIIRDHGGSQGHEDTHLELDKLV